MNQEDFEYTIKDRWFINSEIAKQDRLEALWTMAIKQDQEWKYSGITNV